MTSTFGHPLDDLTADLTAFRTFRELVDAGGTYRPTILERDDRHIDLADGYDAFQAARNDPRRAWRGSNHETTFEVTSAEGHLAVHLAGVPAVSGLYSDWLKVIHAINGDFEQRHPEALDPKVPGASYIGSPVTTRQGVAGSYIEEYPHFRVILRHTSWGCRENSGTIMAKDAQAAEYLRRAVLAVTGHEIAP